MRHSKANKETRNTMRILGKISVKSCGCDLKEARDESLDLLRIYGVVSAIEHGSSDKGSWTRLKGNFEAANLQTGETFMSGACFLPGIVSDLIANQFDPDGSLGAEVQFAFDIGSEPADTATGYSYTVKPLVEPKQSSAIAEMKALVKGN
jgi:hypothetical protein